MNSLKTALYVRVSTEEQAKEGYSINAQIQRLTDFANSQGWEITHKFIDDGYSAKDLDRPEMQNMINCIKNNEFEVVLVYRLDRLVRSVMNLHELLTLFDEHRVMFKSATEMFDTTSAMGRFFITLVGAMAQWERENLGERVQMGMKRMFEEGKRPGASAPFGYDLVNGKLVVNHEEAKWVRFIFDSYKTKGKRAIAEVLNKNGIKTRKGNYWQDGVVTYVANNPIYCGYLRWNYRKVSGNRTYNEMLIKGDHEPIISKEEFDEVQEIMKSRAGKGFKGDTHYPFTGVLRCARCGKPLIGAKRKKKNGFHRYYRCTGRTSYKICDLPFIPEKVIEKEFLTKLHFEDFIIQPQDDFQEQIKELEKELSRIKNAISRTKKMYKWGDYESEIEYRNDLNDLKEQELELTQALESIDAPIDLEQIKQFQLQLKQNWQDYSLESRKLFVSDIVSKIIVEVIQESSGGPGSAPIIEFKGVEVVT